ncbi:MAG: transglutaminase domain-containing protein [Planctomycetota bacterium]
MMPLQASLCVALVLALGLPARARTSGRGDLDPALPYQARLLNPVTYTVDMRATVTAPHGTRLLRVWIPVPPSDAAQTVTDSRFESFPDPVLPSIATERVFGNCFACFEFRNPSSAEIISHRFAITTHELRFDVDAARIDVVTQWPDTFAPFLRGESQAVVLSSAVRAAAEQIVPVRTHELGDLERVLSWIDANLRYDHSHASLQASAEWALCERAGHCSDYHGLCAALMRSLGYPSRVAYGINPMPKSSPSHCKAEVFLPGHGWVCFDLSETQKLCARVAADPALPADRKERLIAAARKRLLAGFRDNTWFLQTRGTDYDLAPPASRKVAVVRTLFAEADGVPLPEPDPADPSKHEFAWMTAHSFTPDRPVVYPYADLASLEQEAGSP